MKTRMLFCLFVAAAAAFAGPVSQLDAEAAASSFTFSLRGASTAGSSWYYEDLAGGPGAWVCERVLGDGSSLTVMCGALDEMPPVLAYWNGKPLDVTASDRAQAVAARTIGAGARRVRAVYYSPLECWFEYAVDGKNVMVSPTRLTANSTAEVRSVPPMKYGAEDARRNRPQWKSLLGGKLPTDDPDSMRITGVSDWDWHYGCSPSSAANVLTYWDNHGYPLLVDSVMWLYDRLEHDWDSVPNVSLQLAIAMGTDTMTGSTWVNNMAPGIEAVCNNSGYGNNYTFDSYCVTNGLGTLISEVRAGRPGCFCVTSHPVYGNHAVTFMGWGPPDTSWICIHDEWNPPNDVVINYNYVPTNVPRYVIPVVPGGLPNPDMAVTAILAPDTVVPQGAVIPRARVQNYGTSAAAAKVLFLISGPGTNYRDSTTVVVSPGQWAGVSFRTWTADTGTFACRCSVAQAGDVNHANDALGRSCRVPAPALVPDMAVTAILSPDPVESPGGIVPSARVANFGNSWTASRVFCFITGPSVNWRDSVLVTVGPAGTAVVTFHSWTADTGTFACRCSVVQAGDVTPANNMLERTFLVPADAPPPPPPTFWHELTPIPAPTAVAVKDGGALAYVAGNGWLYALKGNRTVEFYTFNTISDYWMTLLNLPFGMSGKSVKAGGGLISDGERYLYALKGNNTVEFFRYDVATDSWTTLADVPMGGTNRKVKGGGDMVYVRGYASDYVYMLKGYGCEFWRYATATNQWEQMPQVPPGTKGKWPKGSFMVFDGDHTIYAHKATYHDLWTFDTYTNAWNPSFINGMPQIGVSGRTKRSKDGGSGAWASGFLWALKGGGTGEFWRFDPASHDWTECESIRMYGSAARTRGVKQGGDLTVANNTFYALKGNKTREFWSYTPAEMGGHAGAPALDPIAVQAAGKTPAAPTQLALTPNPAHGTVRVSLPDGCRRIVLRDILGRQVLSASARASAMTLDLAGIAPGVYLVTGETGSGRNTARLIVE